VAVIEAIRKLEQSKRPKSLFGCEVWRGLDWLSDDEKISFDVGGDDTFAKKLIAVHESQIGYGKDYVGGIIGRRAANAVFGDPYGANDPSAISLAINLTPLICDDSKGVIEYVLSLIEDFKKDVQTRLEVGIGRK